MTTLTDKSAALLAVDVDNAGLDGNEFCVPNMQLLAHNQLYRSQFVEGVMLGLRRLQATVDALQAQNDRLQAELTALRTDAQYPGATAWSWQGPPSQEMGNSSWDEPF